MIVVSTLLTAHLSRFGLVLWIVGYDFYAYRKLNAAATVYHNFIDFSLNPKTSLNEWSKHYEFDIVVPKQNFFSLWCKNIHKKTTDQAWPTLLLLRSTFTQEKLLQVTCITTKIKLQMIPRLLYKIGANFNLYYGNLSKKVGED